MKNPAAFISYARRDNSAYGRRITGLREKLQGMVASAIGGDFEIFQDSEGIPWGQHWQTRLDEVLKEALFLIPIPTPSYFNSPACRNELEAFLSLERRSGRQDRILPLYFVNAPVFDDVETTDPLAATLRERQYRQWQSLRILPLSSSESSGSSIVLPPRWRARFMCGRVLQRPSVSPPEAALRRSQERHFATWRRSGAPRWW